MHILLLSCPSPPSSTQSVETNDTLRTPMFMHRAALTVHMTPGTLFRFGGGSLSKIQSWNTSSHPEEWLLASCGRTNVPLPHFFFSLTLSSSLQPSSTHLHPIRQCVCGSSRPIFFSCRSLQMGYVSCQSHCCQKVTPVLC